MIRVGIFTDIHYAKDKQYDDRYCDLSLEKLDKLIDIFNNENVDFSICLGDFIDSSRNAEVDLENLKAVCDRLSHLKAPIHFCIGNHDLDAMDKKTFLSTVKSKSSSPYYSFEFKNIQFVILDANNKRFAEFSCGNFDWTESYIDETQVRWLSKELKSSKTKKSYIFTHQNLDDRIRDGRADPHVIKNAAKVREVLQGSGKNITVFQGHDHKGADSTINGIRYITLRALSDGDSVQRTPCVIIKVDEKNA